MAQTTRRRRQTRQAVMAQQNLMDFLKMGAVMAAVVIVIIMIIRMTGGTSVNPMSSDKFLEGVYVNGTALAGMTFEEGSTLIEQQVDTRLTTPIALSDGSRTWTITPQDLGAKMVDVDNQLALAWNYGHVGDWSQRREQAAELKDEQVHYDSELQYDEAKLDQFIQSIKDEVDVTPVDAQVTLDVNETFLVSQHKDGTHLDADLLKSQVVSAIEQGTSTNIELQPQLWPAQHTKDEMTQATQLIARKTTDARSSNENRTRNIMRALKPFNGYAVPPGVTVSFNEVAKERSLKNGYFEAQEFVNNEITDGVGGGTCQASTTLYQALVQAGMTIDRRFQHSMLVAYCKPSQDATVTNSGKDLVFTNNTDYTMYIFTSCSYTEAQVRIYGMKPEYKIQLVTEYVKKDIPWSGYRTQPDVSRKYVKTAGSPMVEKTPGKLGCKTRGVVKYIDRETGEEAKDPDILSADDYEPMPPTMWVYAK